MTTSPEQRAVHLGLIFGLPDEVDAEKLIADAINAAVAAEADEAAELRAALHNLLAVCEDRGVTGSVVDGARKLVGEWLDDN